MRDLIRQFDLGDAIKFREYSEDVEQIWRDHQGLILPSRYEGAPLVVVEAMLCNRICVATDVGRNRELIDDDETGFIAAAPTPQFLDEALERAWHKRTAWREMGQLAGQRIRQRYGEDPISDFRERLLSLVNRPATSIAASCRSGDSS
jgi:glycosyltransferase involved in cell wall biosynthesis